jgi:hypothetical protein
MWTYQTERSTLEEGKAAREAHLESVNQNGYLSGVPYTSNTQDEEPETAHLSNTKQQRAITTLSLCLYVTTRSCSKPSGFTRHMFKVCHRTTVTRTHPTRVQPRTYWYVAAGLNYSTSFRRRVLQNSTLSANIKHVHLPSINHSRQ